MSHLGGMPRELPEQVHSALQQWSANPTAPPALSRLRVVRRHALGGNARRAANVLLLNALEALSVDFPADAALLRDRYVAGKSVAAVALDRNIAEVTVYKLQKRAVDRLAAIIWDMEQAERAEREAALAQRLSPRREGAVFGIDAHAEQLAALLNDPAAPSLVSLEGIGGIGKTTLAHRVVSDMAARESAFADFAWVSAQQEQFRVDRGLARSTGPAFTADSLIEALAAQLLTGAASLSASRALPALETSLRAMPHLVVVDNLETVADVEALLPALSRLANPTRFLLTSREAAGEPDVYRFPVPELSLGDALALVRAEATTRGLRHVAEVTDDDLAPIYDTVGGNPLALRLVAGQLHLLSLDEVLAGLRQARGRRVEDLYTFIYWRAWQSLTPACQDTLALMPLFAGTGADFAAIAAVSDLDEGDLLDALALLVRLSLVNVSGDIQSRRYGIHRLTETFLLREVIKWQGREAPA